MIKLKDLLKESYVWERKFGEPLPTLADVQKKKLAEGKWSMKGKYLNMPSGEVSSIPGDYDRDAIIVQIKHFKFGIYKQKGKLYANSWEGSGMDKYFKNINDLVKWLNKEKAKYAGIDRR